MSSSIAKDSEVHVTFEDQQSINLFARSNAKLQELKDEIEAKNKELQNLDDACDELLMLEDEAPVPYSIGEVFMLYPQEDTTKMLEENKESLHKEVASMEEKTEGLNKLLSDLKAKLYAKFGTNINLEMDPEESS